MENKPNLDREAESDLYTDDFGQDSLFTEPKRKWYVEVIRWLWIFIVWTTLFCLDISLWVIMTSTSGARSIKPTRRIVFTDKERAYLANMQGRKCMYCGIRLTRDNLQIDHKFPVSRGGSNEKWNLQALCRQCNSRKGMHSDEEFRERYSELLSSIEAPPRNTIHQSRFARIMKATRAHPNVRQANRNRYMTPRQRLSSATPVIIMGGTTIIAIVGGTLFPNIVLTVFVIALIFSVSFSVGLWLRALNKGILSEE